MPPLSNTNSRVFHYFLSFSFLIRVAKDGVVRISVDGEWIICANDDDDDAGGGKSGKGGGGAAAKNKVLSPSPSPSPPLSPSPPSAVKAHSRRSSLEISASLLKAAGFTADAEMNDAWSTASATSMKSTSMNANSDVDGDDGARGAGINDDSVENGVVFGVFGPAVIM
jgi:hypothetical protein